MESLFIGCRVRIISKANIRYEGNLFSLQRDANNDLVLTLSKVMSFGTEDRPCKRAVGPLNQIYEHIAFRAEDLVDLTLIPQVNVDDDPSIIRAELESSPIVTSKPQEKKDIQENLWSSKSKPSGDRPLEPVALTVDKPPTPVFPNFMSPKPSGDLLSDISINPWSVIEAGLSCGRSQPSTDITKKDLSPKISSEESSLPQIENDGQVKQSYPRGGRKMREFKSAYDGRTKTGGYGDRRVERNQVANNDATNQRSNARGHYNQKQRYRNRYNSQKSNDPVFKVDYDLEKANAELAEELEKIEISSNATTSPEQNGDNPPATDPTYDSSKSFFDTLSSEIMDRAKGVVNRHSVREDKRQNFDTFGFAANRVGAPFRGSSGYRGYRGGRGPFRSHYRGGYGGPMYNKYPSSKNAVSNNP